MDMHCGSTSREREREREREGEEVGGNADLTTRDRQQVGSVAAQWSLLHPVLTVFCVYVSTRQQYQTQLVNIHIIIYYACNKRNEKKTK